MKINLANLPLRNGVGMMVFNSDKKIFVGKRIDNQKAWQMPQGGVDKNESLKSAAFRELYEEQLPNLNKSILISFQKIYQEKYGEVNSKAKNKSGI